LLLAGDIGGTKTDLALYTEDGGPRAPVTLAEFPSHDYDSLEAVVREFLKSTGASVNYASFDVAGPVIDGAAKTTNLPWQVESAKLERELGLEAVYLLNDLEAVAYAVPMLEAADLHPLAPGKAQRGGSLAIVAPGTGLGEAFLTWEGDHYVSHASEGGHADFAPADDDQIELLRYLKPRLGHVSFERVCSGIGIPNIYDFLKQQGKFAREPDIEHRTAAAPDRTKVIMDIGVHEPGASAVCGATVAMFTSILGAEAGNLALKVMATGGVYIGGGIPTHILSALDNGPFLEAFRNKGRFHDLMADVPVSVIVAQAALLGAASYGLSRMATDKGKRTRSEA
jgi:glucokinase